MKTNNKLSYGDFKRGAIYAKTDLLEEKERLLDVDERNLITYGAH